jgi:hypothetical protein
MAFKSLKGMGAEELWYSSLLEHQDERDGLKDAVLHHITTG